MLKPVVLLLNASGKICSHSPPRCSKSKIYKGVVHKLRLQGEVGRWSQNVHFLSTFITQKMSKQGGRWSKKVKTYFVNDPQSNYFITGHCLSKFQYWVNMVLEFASQIHSLKEYCPQLNELIKSRNTSSLFHILFLEIRFIVGVSYPENSNMRTFATAHFIG